MSRFVEKYAKIIVVMAVVFGAFSGTIAKGIGAAPLAIGFWRLFLGMPFFAVPVLVKQRDDLKKTARKDRLIAYVSGIFLFLHFTTWFSGLKYTNISNASILGDLHPLVVVAISFLVYKKRIGIKPLIGILVAIVGGAITAGLDYKELPPGFFWGDVLAFMSAIFMGLYFVMGERGRERISGSIYVFLVFASCLTCFAIAMVVTGTPFVGYTSKDYGLLVAMTLICQIGSHAMYNLCLGHVDSVYVSAWGTGDAVFSTIIAMIFVHQMPTVWAIIGCIIVVVGLLYYNFNSETDSR